MAPLSPQCYACGAAVSLSRCTRCQVVLYCRRACQQQDFSAHKPICKRAKQARDLIAPRGGGAEPENVFETSAGHFWGVHETRPYMRAKFELIRTTGAMWTHASTSIALVESLDCLRLGRSDNMGVRDVVPALMLLLGQRQQCYDFIQWWATCDPDGRYDWATSTCRT